MKQESQPHHHGWDKRKMPKHEGSSQPEGSTPPTELEAALDEIQTILIQGRGKSPEQQAGKLKGKLAKIKPQETT